MTNAVMVWRSLQEKWVFSHAYATDALRDHG
jgi:hypothetical protein